MKRRYTAARAVENIERLRTAFPGANFTTDLMVGFPGESEDDFLETVDFVRRVRLLDAHVFAYSRRIGTPAATYEGQIPEAVKRKRSERLIGIKNEVRDAVLGDIVALGKPLDVIVETLGADGTYTAHSDSYVEVAFKAPACKNLQGERIKVTPVSHKNGIVLGEIV